MARAKVANVPHGEWGLCSAPWGPLFNRAPAGACSCLPLSRPHLLETEERSPGVAEPCPARRCAEISILRALADLKSVETYR